MREGERTVTLDFLNRIDFAPRVNSFSAQIKPSLFSIWRALLIAANCDVEVTELQSVLQITTLQSINAKIKTKYFVNRSRERVQSEFIFRRNW